MIKYKNSCKRIDEAIKTYKLSVDTCEKLFIQKERENAEKYAEMRDSGRYTQLALDEFKANEKPNTDVIKARIESDRTKALNVIDAELDKIEKQLEGCFNAPVSQKFANKVQSIALVGMSPTNLELDLMKKEASSYLELKLLSSLAERRTKDAESVSVVNGEVVRKNSTVKDSYHIAVPDASNIMKEFKGYKNRVLGCINNYSGSQNKLVGALIEGDAVAHGISVAFGNSYFDNDGATSFMDAMHELDTIMPQPVRRTYPLTDDENDLLDTLIWSTYEWGRKDQVEKLASKDEHLRELFSLHPEFSKYVPQEDNE